MRFALHERQAEGVEVRVRRLPLVEVARRAAVSRHLARQRADQQWVVVETVK